MNERPYLSIGEVLGLLLEEFPDITISKIRFLESQGLIEPERTASGYRKFYDGDVDRLRYILREQRENYLPLKVIRDRLGDTPSGGLPRGIRNVTLPDPTITGRRPSEDDLPPTQPDHAEPEAEQEITAEITRGHPSARGAAALVGQLLEAPVTPPARSATEATPSAPAQNGTSGRHDDTAPTSRPAASVDVGVAAIIEDATGSLARSLANHISRAELLDAAAADGRILDELESYGLVTPRTFGQQTVYEPQAVAVVRIAAGFVELGLEVRHLKAWRTAAEREAALFEQRITPLLRQRNPQAREQSVDILERLVRLGGEMRAAMLEQALRQYIDPR